MTIALLILAVLIFLALIGLAAAFAMDERGADTPWIPVDHQQVIRELRESGELDL